MNNNSMMTLLEQTKRKNENDEIICRSLRYFTPHKKDFFAIVDKMKQTLMQKINNINVDIDVNYYNKIINSIKSISTSHYSEKFKKYRVEEIHIEYYDNNEINKEHLIYNIKSLFEIKNNKSIVKVNNGNYMIYDVIHSLTNWEEEKFKLFKNIWQAIFVCGFACMLVESIGDD